MSEQADAPNPAIASRLNSELLQAGDGMHSDARLMGDHCRISEELIGERRKALDWVVGVAANWDEIPDST